MAARLLLYGALPAGVTPGDLPPNCEVRGCYTADELEAVFASFDVLVVPSIWFENAPFVIREAFARGKPVIASDLGGMAESVRNEVDGLRFPVGSAGALAQCVQRIVSEPGLLARLRQGVRPPKYYDEHLAELERIYADVAAPAEAAGAPGRAQSVI
jgi:glycosyltransferase involved in cell wall biosynthesis